MVLPLGGVYKLRMYLLLHSHLWFIYRIKKLLDIRKKEKSLKVVVSLGGSHFQWRYLSDMMTSSANRSTFLGTIISYIRTRRFDGFHLDFPFPRESNNPRADRKGFTMLVTVRWLFIYFQVLRRLVVPA